MTGAAGVAAALAGMAGTTLAGTTTSDEPIVTPGMAGFLVTLALVLACIPLIRSMVGKIRGVQYRDQGGSAGGDVAGGDVPDGGVAGSEVADGEATGGEATDGEAADSAAPGDDAPADATGAPDRP